MIEAKQCRANKDNKGDSTQDPQAAWKVKAGSDGKRKSTYGYKAHLNVDEDGLIKATDYRAGSLHDSNCFVDPLFMQTVLIAVKPTMRGYLNAA